MSTIKTEVYTGTGHHPDRNPAIIDKHALVRDPIEDPTPCGSARKEIIVETVNETPKAPHDIDIPKRETDDPATLYAWYGPYGWCENYRKVVLAQCREIERAKAATSGGKVTESRLEDLARLNPIYLQFLADHLKGRQEYEHAFLSQQGMAA